MLTYNKRVESDSLRRRSRAALAVEVVAMKKMLFCIALMLASSPSNSSEVDKFNLVRDNAADEFMHCAIYYNIASIGIMKRGDDDLANKFREYSKFSLDIAVKLIMVDRSEEMARKVAKAKMELVKKSMDEEFGANLSNVSILINKYGDKCKKYLEDPASVMGNQ